MAVFDETLFQVGPRVYRALDEARGGRGRAGRPGGRLPALRQLGRRRPGRQPVRDRPGDQGDGGRSRPSTCCARWRTRPPGSAARSPCTPGAAPPASRVQPRPSRRPRRPTRSCSPSWPPGRRASRTGPSCSTWPGGSRPPGCGTPTWPTAAPRTSSPTCGWSSESLAAAGATRQAFGELQHLIWQAETFGFHLAELEIRQHSAVHARALRRDRRGGGDRCPAQTPEVLATFRAVGLDPGPVRRRGVPPLRGQLHPVGGGHRRRLRAGPARGAERPRPRCWTWSRCSRAART